MLPTTHLHGMLPSSPYHSPSRDAPSRKFRLRFLNANFLEVDEPWLVDVKHESTAVVADGITADRRLKGKVNDLWREKSVYDDIMQLMTHIGGNRCQDIH